MRDVAGRVCPGDAVARCGKFAHGGRVEGDGPRYVTVRHGEAGGDVSGVVTCGSVWHCPVCAAKIAGERRHQCRALINAHLAAGGAVYMATFTVPHHAFQHPKMLRQTVAKAWQKLISGAPWKRAAAAVNLLGFVRSLEVTHGANGWHPHLHVLFFLNDRSAKPAEKFGAWLYERWAGLIARTGLGRTSIDAWKFERAASELHAGDYVMKGALDYELTHAHMKTGRKAGQRSPMQILADVAAFNRPADAELFRQYAAAFKGARQLTFSRGLLAAYELADFTDEDAAAAASMRGAPVALIEAEAFSQLAVRGMLVEMLDVAGRGYLALLAWLCARGVSMAFVRPPPKEDRFPWTLTKS